MTTILRQNYNAFTAKQLEAWQNLPERVKLMPGPWFRSDGTPLQEGDTELPSDYMWTGHVHITPDDDDLADAVARNRGLMTAALNLSRVDDGEGGTVIDWQLARENLANVPKIKTDREARKAAREAAQEL